MFLQGESMLTTIVTILSPGIMLLIIASLAVNALREHHHLARAGTMKPQIPPGPLPGSVALVPREEDCVSLYSNLPQPQTLFSLPPSWYRRRRTLISLGFLFVLFLALFVQSGLADGTLQKLGQSIDLLGNPYSSLDIRTAAHGVQLDASQQLVRISQLDPGQYATRDEYNTWAYSACSAAAMTEVFNAYGHHYRITDILEVEARIGEISPALGLLRHEGIAQTATQFGFKTTWGDAWTLDRVIATANHGNPVIVSFPPDRYAGGHLLVVTGGNSTTVYLADTSLWNRHSLTYAQFLQWWEGYAAVVTPR
jgi:hypothetical protein